MLSVFFMLVSFFFNSTSDLGYEATSVLHPLQRVFPSRGTLKIICRAQYRIFNSKFKPQVTCSKLSIQLFPFLFQSTLSFLRAEATLITDLCLVYRYKNNRCTDQFRNRKATTWSDGFQSVDTTAAQTFYKCRASCGKATQYRVNDHFQPAVLQESISIRSKHLKGVFYSELFLYCNCTSCTSWYLESFKYKNL